MDHKTSRLEGLRIDRNEHAGGGSSKLVWGLAGALIALVLLIGFWMLDDAEGDPAIAAQMNEATTQAPSPRTPGERLFARCRRLCRRQAAGHCRKQDPGKTPRSLY